tara:strand:- start:936 stop:1049 length:114 start_codon:yes stop_codon:yes gene_type:complete
LKEQGDKMPVLKPFKLLLIDVIFAASANGDVISDDIC